MKQSKRAFTIIELIYTIVILSIVAMIGSQILRQIYESYITTRTINELQTKTELVLNQIAKRLSYRIKESAIARDLDNPTHIVSVPMAADKYEILEWIGYDNEGFRGVWDGNKITPGWSGLVDLYHADTNKTQIKTAGSSLDGAADIIYTLSDGAVDLNNSYNAAIIFKGLPVGYDVNESYGWNEWAGIGAHNHVYPVKRKTDDILEFDLAANKTVYEQYYLAWSAYAVVPEPVGTNDTNDWNLKLYYNYRPWNGDSYSDDGDSSLLLEHVSAFKFRQIGNVLRLKLCAFKEITPDYKINFCKEKVVY